jgi:hypothetical protein
MDECRRVAGPLAVGRKTELGLHQLDSKFRTFAKSVSFSFLDFLPSSLSGENQLKNLDKSLNCFGMIKWSNAKSSDKLF